MLMYLIIIFFILEACMSGLNIYGQKRYYIKLKFILDNKKKKIYI